MRKSFKKIVASLLAATMLTIGSTAVTANAISWSLHNAVGAPGSANQYSDPANFSVYASTSTISEQCTYYSSGQNSSGRTAYATYNVYAVTKSGEVLNGLTGIKYHEQRDTSASRIPLSQSVPANSSIYGNYSLKNYNSINTTINGTIS